MEVWVIGSIVLALAAATAVAGPAAADEPGATPAPRADAAPMSDRQAAEAGDAAAQRRLGRMFEEGVGAPPDLDEALRWYRRAAAQGDVGAQDDLGRLYSGGVGGPGHAHEAALWELKAAAAGDRLAAVLLGERYLTGNGLPRDLPQARAWYRKAGETAALCFTWRGEWLAAAATRRAAAMDAALAGVDPACPDMIDRGRTWSARLRAGRPPAFDAEAWLDARGAALQCGPATVRPRVAGRRAARAAFLAWEAAHWPDADRRRHPYVLVSDGAERWIVARADADAPATMMIAPSAGAGQLKAGIDKCSGAVAPLPERPLPPVEPRNYE